MALKKKQISPNSDLFKLIQEPGWKSAPASERKEMERAIRKSALLRKHGGARPGAGRKKTGTIRTVLLLKPETRAVLMRKAGGPRGMATVVDSWARQNR